MSNILFCTVPFEGHARALFRFAEALRQTHPHIKLHALICGWPNIKCSNLKDQFGYLFSSWSFLDTKFPLRSTKAMDLNFARAHELARPLAKWMDKFRAAVKDNIQWVIYDYFVLEMIPYLRLNLTKPHKPFYAACSVTGFSTGDERFTPAEIKTIAADLLSLGCVSSEEEVAKLCRPVSDGLLVITPGVSLWRYGPRDLWPSTIGADSVVPELGLALDACPHGDKKDTILISLGSIVTGSLWTQNPRARDAITQLLANLVEGASGFDIVVVAGKRSWPPEEWRKRFPRATWHEFFDQAKFLARGHVCLLVTHGGCNSVREAALYGVPMLVLPFFGDQHSVARRVEELGWGRAVLFNGRDLEHSARSNEIESLGKVPGEIKYPGRGESKEPIEVEGRGEIKGPGGGESKEPIDLGARSEGKDPVAIKSRVDVETWAKKEFSGKMDLRDASRPHPWHRAALGTPQGAFKLIREALTHRPVLSCGGLDRDKIWLQWTTWTNRHVDNLQPRVSWRPNDLLFGVTADRKRFVNDLFERPEEFGVGNFEFWKTQPDIDARGPPLIDHYHDAMMAEKYQGSVLPPSWRARVDDYRHWLETKNGPGARENVQRLPSRADLSRGEGLDVLWRLCCWGMDYFTTVKGSTIHFAIGPDYQSTCNFVTHLEIEYVRERWADFRDRVKFYVNTGTGVWRQIDDPETMCWFCEETAEKKMERERKILVPVYEKIRCRLEEHQWRMKAETNCLWEFHGRVKSKQSWMEKMIRCRLPVGDTLGFRIVCFFGRDVARVIEYLHCDPILGLVWSLPKISERGRVFHLRGLYDREHKYELQIWPALIYAGFEHEHRLVYKPSLDAAYTKKMSDDLRAAEHAAQDSVDKFAASFVVPRSRL